MMKCPWCNSEMKPVTDLVGNIHMISTGLPIGSVVESEFRCLDLGCYKPIILVSGVWYKWVVPSGNSIDNHWEPFEGSKPKPRKISSNFVGAYKWQV